MSYSRLYRFYEMIPGILIWTALAGSVILSFLRPLWVITFIIVFDLYWLFRVGYFVFYILLSWRRFRRAVSENWLTRVQALPDWRRIRHLVFLPIYGEDEAVVRATLTGLARANYPHEKMLVVLAGEERKKEEFSRLAQALTREFGHRFGRMWVTVHPKDLAGEIPGKGSNLHYSGRMAQKLIDGMKIPYEDIIVSAFDADTVAHPQYFAYLAHRYLTVPNPTRASYQPIALYNNNIWDAPAPVRVAALGTTFWLMTELSRPERLFTFSSHSMPFRALVDAGFWQKDIVSEDSRIFLQCFLRYHGDYRVEPLFMPVSMDAVSGKNYRQSLVNLYKQQRRWAWGVENIPFMIREFLRDPLIPAAKRLKYLWNQGEGMFSWAIAPLLIFLLGRLPFLATQGELHPSLLYYQTPGILQWLMRLAMAGLLVSVILTVFLLPPKPETVPSHKKLFLLLQWALLPLTLVIFGSLPAIDAQTRLMVGRSLGFNVTEKRRKEAALAG